MVYNVFFHINDDLSLNKTDIFTFSKEIRLLFLKKL